MRQLAQRLTKQASRMLGAGRRGALLEPIPVFHMGRCGSTVLERMVAQHSAMVADGEIFHKGKSNWQRHHSDLTPHQYTAQRLADMSARFGHRKVYMFEVKFLPGLDLAHFGDSRTALYDVMQDIGVRRAVILDRRNVLRRLVSTLLAVTRGQYNARPGQDIAPTTVHFPLDRVHLGRAFTIEAAIEAVRGEYASLDAELRDLGIEVLSLTYEDDILGDPKTSYRRVVGFADQAPEGCKIPLKRMQTAPLSEVIRNYGQLEARLTGTEHEWMLTAD